MDTAHDNDGSYSVTVQGIEHFITSHYQELCICSGREFILYGWYGSMAYTCGMDPTDDKYIFP